MAHGLPASRSKRFLKVPTPDLGLPWVPLGNDGSGIKSVAHRLLLADVVSGIAGSGDFLFAVLFSNYAENQR